MELLCMGEGCFHDTLCPEVIFYIGTTAYFLDRFLRIVISYISLVSSVLISIVLWCHVTTTAPVLISYTKEINCPWLLTAIFFPKIRHRGNTIEGHILNPL